VVTILCSNGFPYGTAAKKELGWTAAFVDVLSLTIMFCLDLPLVSDDRHDFGLPSRLIFFTLIIGIFGS
jgi:hypothetical protein